LRSSSSCHRATRFICGFATWLCLIRFAGAMDPNRAMSQYVHDKWGAGQGFPKGPVYAIAQGGDGYLWIGSEAGLVRFDGWNFRLIKDESHENTVGKVFGLASDDEGCLLIRSDDLRMLRYCKGKFDQPVGAPKPYEGIEAMSRGNRGEVLVWSSNGGGAKSFSGGKSDRLASAASMPRRPVISLARAGNGDLYLGTWEGGLFRAADGKIDSIREGLPDSKVNCLLADGEKGMWIGTDRGIARWNGREFIDSGIPPALGHFQALAMVRDRDGNVWVGTDSRGLLRLNSGGLASLIESDHAPVQAITALFEDREGNLWIGHADGVERLHDSAFVTYSTPEGLPTDGSNPVFVDSRNRMWFPPVAGGLWWVKDGAYGHVVNDGLNKDVVYSIDGAGDELWVARQHGGLTRLRFEDGSIASKTYTHADGLAQDSLYSVYLARDGAVWTGSLSAGVSELRNGRFTNFTIANGLASNTVVSILQGSDGAMWFATPGGLSTLSKGRWQTYSSRDGLPSENVNCFLEDATGVLWVGTASGIAFRGTDGFKIPARLPAMLREQILGLAEDKNGSLWVATSSRVLRVNREKLRAGATGEGDVGEYGLADGLRGVEGVKRHRSVVTDPAGRIWFSLNRGISVVDPGRLSRTSAPALVHIQTILADADPIGGSGVVHIPGGRKRITFDYVGLSLSVPDRVRYRYWLEGYDHGWSEPTADREAGYTNLPPRPYRFNVMAANPDGIWNTKAGVVDFEVDPLFWQTWWFRLCVALALVGSMLAVYRLRLRQITRRINLRFQERLAERTRIAQELHDTLLQGFLSASMQVHVAADRLPEDSSAKPTLSRALELMRQVIDEGRNAVRGLRSSHSASLDLEQAFSRIQQEFVAGEHDGQQVDFRVIVDGERRPLHPVLRDEVYRIGREAAINAFRHAHARKIEMELRYSPDRLAILVRDDGRGIDSEVLQTGRDGHWGLSGMQERAKRIGGRLHVYSNLSAGTEVELLVPGKIAFESQPSRKARWLGSDSPRMPRQNGGGQ